MKTKLLTYLGLFIIAFLTVGAINIKEESQSDWIVTIKRTSYNSNSVTGELFVNGRFICHTLELPWKSNKSYISSIPSGEYSALLRYDKNDKWRLQLENVPNRSGVQIHIGNYPSQIQGCVLVGESAINKENRLENSSKAYKRLKRAFYGSDNPSSTPNVNIKIKIEYNNGRTKLINQNGILVWEHAKENLWLYGNEKLENYEYKRDLDYIYIKYRGPNTYFRYPLNGGISEISRKSNGPWRKGTIRFRREN